MRRLWLFTFMIFMATAVTCFAGQPLASAEGVVSRVVSGDKLEVTVSTGKKLKIRLYGVAAPRNAKFDKMTGQRISAGQPFGEAAFKALRDKVNGQKVRLDFMSIGKNDKLRAIVWLGSRNINREMLAEGWGWAKLQHLSPDDSTEYTKYAETARAKRLGLWQQPNPQPPWEFRIVEKLRMLLDAI